MKILMVSSYLPFPLKSGGEIRLFNLIKNISQNHEITLICEKRNYQTESDVKEVEKICKKVITVERKKQWGVKNILKTGFSVNSFLVTGHTSSEMKKKINVELQEEKYDLIHVETFYVMQNLPETSLPVILVEHNIEYLVYERYAKMANPIFKPLLLIDVKKIKTKEEQAWQKAAKLVAVSKSEKELMAQKREDVVLVSNGVNLDEFKFVNMESKSKIEEKRILFIGDFRWLQNRDAAVFIVKEVWPKILSKFNTWELRKKIKLWFVGRHMSLNLKNLTDDTSIIFDKNNIQKTPEIFKDAYVLLAPLRAGGGTSYKILEAMASGVGVVTTKLGIEGLGAMENEHALVGETPEELAEAVYKLLTKEDLYKKLTENSRKFVEENYDWKIISKKLEDVYKSVIN